MHRLSPLAALLALCILQPAQAQDRASLPQPGGGQAAIPRLSDGKPDFTGVWAGPGFGHKPDGPGDTDTPLVVRFDRKKMSPFKPGGEALMIRPLTGDVMQDDPGALCFPNGLTRQLLAPYSQQIVQMPGRLVILYEYMHFFRAIPTDGSPHDADADTTWMGDSVAKWDGDTLVIDTTNLKEWVFDSTHDEEGEGSRWHSDQLHVIERLHYLNPNLVAYDITIDDPAIFTAPWTQNFQMMRHPSWKLFESICEENNRCEAGKCTVSDIHKNNNSK